MATRNGARKKPPAKTVPVLPVVLDQNELTGLKNRWETWQNQRHLSRFHQLLELMAHESYTNYVRELQAQYKLPDNYTVNFNTGIVTETQED